MADAAFAKETDLCAAFLTCVPDDWIAYPETCGWDIVLAHRETGIQIGIEAKLTLNAKVLVQAVETAHRSYRIAEPSPDFRAVLVGRVVAENSALAGFLGLKVLHVQPADRRYCPPQGTPKSAWMVNRYRWEPAITEWNPRRRKDDWYGGTDGWTDWAPPERLRLPEYLPRVAAGASAPRKLTDWTIQAIKLCIMLGRINMVSRAHFGALKLSPSRWCDGHWLAKGPRGFWMPGPRFPGGRLKREHPEVWAEIEADWAKWGEPIVVAAGGRQGALL